jgi:hypothetical protein
LADEAVVVHLHATREDTMIEILERRPAAARAGPTAADRAKVQRFLQPLVPLVPLPAPPLAAAGSRPAAGAPTAAWAPAGTAAVCAVEGLVTMSLMGYFAIMLLAALDLV